MVQLEAAFLKNHGVAELARVLSDKTRLCPILRLALARNATPSDTDVERAKWDVVCHLRMILRDPSYMPRDLVAAMACHPRDLAVLLIRQGKKGSK